MATVSSGYSFGQDFPFVDVVRPLYEAKRLLHKVKAPLAKRKIEEALKKITALQAKEIHRLCDNATLSWPKEAKDVL